MNKRQKLTQVPVRSKLTVQPKTPFEQRISLNHRHLSLNLPILSGPFYFVFYPDIHGERILLLGKHKIPKKSVNMVSSMKFTTGYLI